MEVYITVRKEMKTALIASLTIQKHFRKKKSTIEGDKPAPVSISVTFIASYRRVTPYACIPILSFMAGGKGEREQCFSSF